MAAISVPVGAGNRIGIDGTVFAITALPIPGCIMLECQMSRSELGTIAIGSAALNDAIGWLLFACVAVCWWRTRPALHALLRRNDVTAQHLPRDVFGFVLAAVFVSERATCRLGILSIVGGFMVGVLLHDVPGFVTALVLPLFFTCTALRTDVGAMMKTRALMELVVVNAGFDPDVIPQPVFSILVLMAIVITVIATLLLKRWLPRWPAGQRSIIRSEPCRPSPPMS